MVRMTPPWYSTWSSPDSPVGGVGIGSIEVDVATVDVDVDVAGGDVVGVASGGAGAHATDPATTAAARTNTPR
jgi:hypothetical protein